MNLGCNLGATYTSCKMLSLTYSEVPPYLHDSDFFRGLNADDPNTSFEIPVNCFRETDKNIIAVHDLESVLHVAQFWGLYRFPQSILDFCYDQSCSLWEAAIVNREHSILIEIFQHPSTFTLQKAIKSERPEVIEFWLSKNDQIGAHSRNAIAQACKYGRLDLVKTLRERDFACDVTAYYGAAQNGYLHILKYLNDNGCFGDSYSLAYASRGGQLECMKFLYSIGCPWSASVTMEYVNFPEIKKTSREINMMSHNDACVECLLFALENGCPIHTDACTIVAKRGLLNCLKLLHNFGGVWDTWATSSAVHGGHLDCLQYLHENGCPWDAQTTRGAALSGHVDCLRFAIKFGCPYLSTLLIDAASAVTIVCLQYLIEDELMGMDESSAIYMSAFSAGRYKNMQYLFDIGCSISGVSFSATNLENSSAVDSDLVHCLQLALDWRLDITEELYTYVSDWDVTFQSYRYPMCRELLNREWCTR